MFQSCDVIQSYIWQDIPDVFFSFASTIQWSNQNKTTLLYKASLQQLITSGKGDRRESKMTARFQRWVTWVMRFQKQNGEMTAGNSDRFMRSGDVFSFKHFVSCSNLISFYYLLRSY